MWKYILSCVLLFAYATADHPIWEIEEMSVTKEIRSEVGDEVYRLPETVVPLEYDIHLDLYFAERTDRPYSYDGREFITIKPIVPNVTQIVLHSNVDEIPEVTLTRKDSGALVDLSSHNPYFTESQYHFLKINIDGTLEQDSLYVLYIKYSKTMNEGPLKRGIWRGYYHDADGVERVYAATHFQPYNARQAFPCWDEPLYKATFQLHISRPASFQRTFSNTEIISFDRFSVGDNDRIRESFYPTPKMSSYLVTFLVSESFQVIAEDDSFTPPIRIIGRSNTEGLGDHTLNLVTKMTEYFDEYFDMPYSTFDKHLMNDHVSTPDWASAGTENWGMVSYREIHTTLNLSETITSVEHYTTTLVSHEMAHKWFGNFITCFWWSNTWINEGFASYFGYMAADKMFPIYELPDHFNARYLHSTLSVDSSSDSVPMNHDVNTPAQVTGHFGTISYNKAASFLRMTADIISPETFQKACQIFLKSHEFLPVGPDDLYLAFVQAIASDNSLSEYSNFHFPTYYDTWVNKPGYPLLTVEIDHPTGEMFLSQERFFLTSNTSSNEIYPIPITFSTKSNNNFLNLKPNYILMGDRAMLRKTIIDGEEWVIFNHMQHGIYRVNYDDRTWELIAEALLNTRLEIHNLNRAQIVDDVFAFMRTGRLLTYNKGFQILKFLRYEDDYHVWTAAISGYSWLRNRLRHLPEKRAEFDSYILSYMEQVLEEYGFELPSNESPTLKMLRQEILFLACELGHERCIEDAVSRFDAMRDSDTWIDPRIRRHIYKTGIREGGERDFEFLLDRFNRSNFASDRLEMLRGLAATRYSVLFERLMDLTLEKSVRQHDKLNVFNYALAGHSESPALVLDYVKKNIDVIRVAYVEDAPNRPVHSALSNLAGYLNEEQLDDYENWLRTTQTGTAQYASTLAAINTARNNIAWGTEYADTILAAARDSASIVVTSTIMLIFMIFLTILV